MNTITKTAVGTSIAALILLGIVILSGASYPDSLYTYGTGISLILLLASLILYAAGWGRDFWIAFKQQNKYGLLILVVSAILVVFPILMKYGLS